MAARWSKSHRWSNPASSAIFQMFRSSSMEIHWPDALRPKRSGCVILHVPLSVKTELADADGVGILLREHLGRPPETLDLVAVLAHVGRLLVRRRLGARDLALPRCPDDDLAELIRVEVELDVRVFAHVTGLDPGGRVDEEGARLVQKPDGHGLRAAVAAGGHEPDDELFLQPRLDLPAGHDSRLEGEALHQVADAAEVVPRWRRRTNRPGRRLVVAAAGRPDVELVVRGRESRKVEHRLDELQRRRVLVNGRLEMRRFRQGRDDPGRDADAKAERVDL